MYSWLLSLSRCNHSPATLALCWSLHAPIRSLAAMLAAAIPLLALGCSTWSAATVTELPLPQMPHDSVVVEVAFVRVPPKQPLADLWPQIDEQHVDIETRRNLQSNGIRCGVVGAQMPARLRELMATPSLARADGSTHAGPSAESAVSDDVTSLYRKLQNRSGERSDVIVVPTIAKREVVLFNENGHVRAEAFSGGQALFDVRSYPSGDGTVRIELVPEIRHGDLKHQWVPGNGTFLHDVGRAADAFDQLRISVVISPGQTLLVTGTDERKGLGGLLFTRGSGESSERLILLLRLAHTQYDDLFGIDDIMEPLATPLD